MCGIFGIICGNKEIYSTDLLKEVFSKLAKYSESRGKESCGFAGWNYERNEISVLRGALPVSSALKETQVKAFLKSHFVPNARSDSPIVLIGHSRLVTNGSQANDFNNQPVIKDGVIAVHNGIIVNTERLWEKYPELKRNYQIDTEIFLSLIRFHINRKEGIKEAVHAAMNEAEGTISAVLMFNDYRQIYFCTNNGSLYLLTDNRGLAVFASEEYILKRLISYRKLKNVLSGYRITHIAPGTCIAVDPFCMQPDKPDENKRISGRQEVNSEIILLPEIKSSKLTDSLADLDRIMNNPIAVLEKTMLEHNYEAIGKLKRCTKCILPETFPYIEFDEQGVCNYCRNYVKRNQPKPVEALKELIEPYKREGKNTDCIIPYSGGRDSSFVLHYAKKELGLKPVAFTYDWGMVTDLARRNIARVCGKLGVENIIVSADIHWKRENIRKNILAWLNNPHLGMIPLFMAGDKYFFYYTHKLKKQTGIKLNIWGINPLENTDFKVGFAGIAPEFDKKRIYSLNYLSQMHLLLFMAKNFLTSPAYINRSVPDTFGSYLVRYFYPKNDYYHLYDYLRWDEKMIENTIINEYDWERAVDTKSTWRIGDGTASFYNYIYYNVAGFSENDTFRSNQIREGMIDRDAAMQNTAVENTPRYETIKWYLQIVGLDYESTIKAINKIPKLYRE
jgi:glutamine---fructose-6-phosphate transaminase (isomerizing)